MLTFFGRWLKGLIAGWLMAFIFFLIKRAMKRAFGDVADMERQAQQARPSQRHQTSSQDVIETIWDGMSSAHLIDSFGAPDQKLRSSPIGEIWIYRHMAGRTSPTEIHIENGSVTKWQAAASQGIEQR